VPLKINKKLRVLIACELSGMVRDAFAKLGHYAVSCDLEQTEKSGLHFQGDVREIINRNWDLMIAHPPCKHLAVSGAKHFYKKRNKQNMALAFVRFLMNAPIKHICIENPVGIISTKIRKPDQIIQPWQFGESIQKKTCLWLKNLPLLQHTKIVPRGWFAVFESGKMMPKWYYDASLLPQSKRSKIRGKSFRGIANAMAHQWSKYLSALK
jgi:site-specific DNA-cytosine methylase